MLRIELKDRVVWLSLSAEEAQQVEASVECVRMWFTEAPAATEEAEVPISADGAQLQGLTIEEHTEDGKPVVNVTIQNTFSGNIQQLTINGQD